MKTYSFLENLILLILIVANPFALFSQINNQELEMRIRKDIESSRKIDGLLYGNDYKFDPSNEKRFLAFIKRYENDSLINIRSWVQAFKVGIWLRSKDISVKQQVVEGLITNCSDPSASISQPALTMLLEHANMRDFSDTAKKMLIAIFNQKKDDGNFLLLCGTAQVKELFPAIKEMATGFNRNDSMRLPRWWQTTGWYASLAAACMGDTSQIDKMITAVELEIEPVFRVTTLLRYLAYTGQPDCIRLLQKYLESEERLPTVKEPAPGTKFNQYAIWFLAQYFENFPVKDQGTTGYSEEEIETARTYLKNWWDKSHPSH